MNRSDIPRSSSLAASLIALAFATMAIPVAAQGDFFLSTGSAVYGSDEFCVDSDAFLTHYRAGFSWEAVGVSAAFINNDYPWPESQAASQPSNRLTRGNAWQGVVELFPLAFFRSGEGGSSVGEYVRPFVGVGIQYTGDADPSTPAGELPIFVVDGRTDVLAAYGAHVTVPLGSSGVRALLQFRGTTLFPSEFKITDTQGQTRTQDGNRLTWGELTVGVSVQR